MSNEKCDDPIAIALDLVPLEDHRRQLAAQKKQEVQPVIEYVQAGSPEEAVEQDYEFARKSIHDAISKGVGALDDMVNLAKMSEHPRAYEVLATLINTITASSESLMDLNKKRKDLNKRDKDPDAPTTVNNTLVMTTADLLRELKNDE